MINHDDLVFSDKEYVVGFDKNNQVIKNRHGLTKREYFAAMAMQGFISTGKQMPEGISNAEASVAYADALIKELSK